MKNILITGSTGFLGRNFKKFVSRKSNFKIYESNTKKNNLLTKNWDSKLKKIKFNYIFHFASFTKPTRENKLFMADIWNTNNQINFEIVNFWIKYQKEAKFITFSSSCIYSNDEKKIEKNCFKGDPEKQLFYYGQSKRNLMLSLFTAARQYNMRYIIYIPTILYGPNFAYNDKHFIYDIIRKIHIAKKTGDFVYMNGSPENRRDLIYIDDVVKIIFNNLNLNNMVINLTNRKHLKISDYTKIISKLINYKSKNIIFKEEFKDDILIRDLYNTELKKIYNIKNLINYNSGLAKTVNFFYKNYAK